MISKLIEGNGVLTRLDISSNILGDDGLAAFSAHLSHAPRLTHLRVGDSGTGRTGAGALAAAINRDATPCLEVSA